MKLTCLLLLFFIVVFENIEATSAFSCQRKGIHANLVGGGWLGEERFVTVEHFDSGVAQTKLHFRNKNGEILKTVTHPLGSMDAIACAKRQLVAVSHITTAFGDGERIVQVYLYNGDGTKFAEIFRNTKDRDWQMYFSPSCNRLLVRMDDKKSQLWAIDTVENIALGALNNFDSRKDGKWMQLASDTMAITGSGKQMRQQQLLGTPGAWKPSKVRSTFKVTGNVQRFGISPNSQYIFVIGKNNNKKKGPFAFKNLVRMFPNGRLVRVLDNNPDDLFGVHAAFSPNGKHFAGIFGRENGNILKIYNGTGTIKPQATLQHQALEGTSAQRVYFNPSGERLLVLGDYSSTDIWVCTLSPPI